MSNACPNAMLARVTTRVFPPNVIDTCSPNFESSNCANALSQNVNDAFILLTNSSFGHVALTLSAVALSLAEMVALIAPKLLQKR